MSCDVFKPKAAAVWFFDGLKHPFDEAGHFPTDIHPLGDANQISAPLEIDKNFTQCCTDHIVLLCANADKPLAGRLEAVWPSN